MVNVEGLGFTMHPLTRAPHWARLPTLPCNMRPASAPSPMQQSPAAHAHRDTSTKAFHEARMRHARMPARLLPSQSCAISRSHLIAWQAPALRGLCRALMLFFLGGRVFLGGAGERVNARGRVWLRPRAVLSDAGTTPRADGVSGQTSVPTAWPGGFPRHRGGTSPVIASCATQSSCRV